MSADKVDQSLVAIEKEREELSKRIPHFFDDRFGEYFGTDEERPEFSRICDRIEVLEEMEKDICKIPELTEADVIAYELREKQKQKDLQIEYILECLRGKHKRIRIDCDVETFREALRR